MSDALEDVWRRETPHVLGALVRRYGDFAACEDALQEALLAAARQWPRDGLPDRPRGWLVQVASHRLIDQRRSDGARTARELTDFAARPADADVAPAADVIRSDHDDTLAVLLLCCHPALRRPAQVALTLRAVAGLTTAQIAAAHLVPETTMGQRVSRAKAALTAAGATIVAPSPADLPARVTAVLDVLLLVFNEGYATSGGDRLVDVSLTREAVRLARQLHAALPAHDEAAAALALMLLTHARTAARVDRRGDLVPLAEQDRSRWDAALIAEGVALVERVLPRGPVGPHQLRAAIAAVHAEATTWAATDWPQIRELYRMLDALEPGPVVTLNRAVAEAMAGAPADGLALLEPLDADPAMRRHHRLHAVRAHLLEMAGDLPAADAAYATAASLTTSTPEQRYLHRRRARLGRPLWQAGPPSGR